MAKYAAGWNMPGYMPEMDVVHFDNFDDAKQYIIDELLNQADQSGALDEEDLAEDYNEAAEDTNLESRPFSVGPLDQYIYWVDEISEEDYDPDED